MSRRGQDGPYSHNDVMIIHTLVLIAVILFVSLCPVLLLSSPFGSSVLPFRVSVDLTKLQPTRNRGPVFWDKGYVIEMNTVLFAATASAAFCRLLPPLPPLPPLSICNGHDGHRNLLTLNIYIMSLSIYQARAIQSAKAQNLGNT